MHRFWIAVIGVTLLGCQATGDKKARLQTTRDTLSYSIGLNFGHNLKRDSVDIDPQVFLQGLVDAGKDSAGRLLTDEQAQGAIMTYQHEQQTRLEAGAKVAGEKNRKEGEAFLAMNGKQQGVVTLPSGLQYKVIVAGKGKMPKMTSTVTTQYSGKLLDGTEFDSSYKRGEAATFPVARVIKGWSEALQLMKEGSTWELYVPSDLAYGPGGTGDGTIPPNATLIFRIELIAVK